MSYEIPFADTMNKSPLNHSTAKMMFSFPKTERFNYGYGKNSSKTFLYNIPDLGYNKGTSIGYGRKSDFTKVSDIHKAPFYTYEDGFDTKISGKPAYSFGVSRHCFDKVIQPNKGIPEKHNPGPGRYETLKTFGEDGVKITINPLKTEKSLKTFITPGPAEYNNLDMNLGKKYSTSSLRNSVNMCFTQTKRFLPPFKIITPGVGTYTTKSLINGTGDTFFSNFKSTAAVSITGRFKSLKKFTTPGPGSYNTTYTDFGGLYDYNHNRHKSYDGRVAQTYNDTLKRTTFNTNSNENNHYYTTGFRYDFLDFNKITEENKKLLKDVEEKNRQMKTNNTNGDNNNQIVTHSKNSSKNTYKGENLFRKSSNNSVNPSEKLLKKNESGDFDNVEKSQNLDNNSHIRNQSESNLERFKNLEKSVNSKNKSFNNNNMNSSKISERKVSISNKSYQLTNNRYSDMNNELNNNYEQNTNNLSKQVSHLSGSKKFSEKGNLSNLNEDENGEEENNENMEENNNSRFYLEGNKKENSDENNNE